MEEAKITENAVQEIKNANEEQLREVIEKWFESIRTDGMKIGARYMSAGIFGIIQKHLKKKSKPSLRDYQRMVDEIIQIISVQLVTEQNDLGENVNDGATEDSGVQEVIG